jgi:hypothetical protein
MEFSSQPAQLLAGSCPGCGHAFTVLEGLVQTGHGAPGSRDQTSGTGETLAEEAARPPCSLCGAPLEITASARGLSAVCSGCSSTFQYVLRSEADRPYRRSSGPAPSPREDRGLPDASRARPCRNCGGPLQFSTSPDGLVTGTCPSCGNRFTLPPRRDFGNRGRGGGTNFRDGYRPRRAAGRWSRTGDRGAPPSRFRAGGPPFRRRSDRSEDDDDSPRKYRRRRDDG